MDKGAELIQCQTSGIPSKELPETPPGLIKRKIQFVFFIFLNSWSVVVVVVVVLILSLSFLEIDLSSVGLPGLEFTMQTKLASNSQRSVCLILSLEC